MSSLPTIVTFNVGGQSFTTTDSVLMGETLDIPPSLRPQPLSILHRIVTNNPSLPQDDHGRPFVDKDPVLFHSILCLLRNDDVDEGHRHTPILFTPPNYTRPQLLRAVNSWGLPAEYIANMYMDPLIVRVIWTNGRGWRTAPTTVPWLRYKLDEQGRKWLVLVRWIKILRAFARRGYELSYWTAGTTGSEFLTFPVYAIFTIS